jgi:uncharacterized protein YndB with AHSA1/START domain
MTTTTQVPTTLDLKRIFAEPRARVFNAWIDPKQLAVWWGPKGFTNPVCEADARPGGAILIHMRAPDGVVYPMTGEFLDVSPPERLVFTSAALDGNGQPMFVNRNTVIFTEVPGGTEISLHVTVVSTTPAAPQYLKGMEQGWILTLDRLGDMLKHN